MRYIPFNPHKMTPTNFKKLLFNVNNSSQGVELITPFGRFYIKNQRQYIQNEQDKNMLQNKAHKAHELKPWLF